MEEKQLKTILKQEIKGNYFTELNNINVSDKTEKKNGLTYLSWAWAWGEVKKLHPTANYTIYERETEYGPVNYFTDGTTAWVKTGVVIDGIEHIEELPVMDFKNKSILLENITSFDVNKTIQRSLTKALARHGLGLYIYAGEDLPEEEATKKVEPEQIKKIRGLIPEENMDAMLKYYKIEKIEDMLFNDAVALIERKENANGKNSKH
jgi:hypothetical protein